MRVLLDVHPSVRCGPETHILPHMLYLYSFKINPMFKRLNGANITHELVDSIFVRAISTLLHNTGPSAERLCAKDPFIDLCLKQLLYLYPKSQFILMVRDGRAVANSVLRLAFRLLEGSFGTVNFKQSLTYGECFSRGCHFAFSCMIDHQNASNFLLH